MLEVIGFTMIGGSVAAALFPDLKRQKVKAELVKACENGKLYQKKNKVVIYPKMLNVSDDGNRTTIVFSIPKGLNPEQFHEKEYVFKQHFGKHIDLKVDEKRAILKVFPEGLPNKFKYEYNDAITGNLPIVCGHNLDGDMYSFDLVKNPHILISGETGSGKSSEIRSILTTLILYKEPKDLRLILGDLKRSEFHLFKRLEHVDGVFHSADELRPELQKVKREMVSRGNKLDAAEVSAIEDLREELPYIVVCIDEVVLLKKETDIMDTLEEISSIGRSLGVYIMLALQRPDSKVMEGKLKVNLTVRMGFKTADSTNSKVIGTPGSEKLSNPGRMMLKVNSNLQEIQCPWLDVFPAKKLLRPYKTNKKPKEQEPVKDKYAEVLELFNNDDET